MQNDNSPHISLTVSLQKRERNKKIQFFANANAPNREQ